MASIVDQYIFIKTVDENGDIVTALVPKREPTEEPPPKEEEQSNA